MKRPGCYKIITVGDPGVGKTTLLEKYCNNKSVQVGGQQYKSTIGADFLTKKIEVNSSPVVLHIWDTAGQERFLALCVAFYRGSDAAILVYDVTNPRTIESLEKWLHEVYKHCDPPSKEDFPIYVIGNKIDDENSEIVHNKSLAEKWCGEKKLPHICVSAVTSENVDAVFLQVATEINRIEKKRKEAEIVQLNTIPIKNDIQPTKTIKSPSHRVTLGENNNISNSGGKKLTSSSDNKPESSKGCCS